MIIVLCFAIIVCLAVEWIGISKSRKSVKQMVNQNMFLVSYLIKPSRHEVCIKPILGRNTDKCVILN